ncbi:MAG: hypothetical protein JXR37_01880 [Kiritimatiellae bacterium]|nr:hypothetical protein [Kiritimatiellia bacterium]
MSRLGSVRVGFALLVLVSCSFAPAEEISVAVPSCTGGQFQQKAKTGDHLAVNLTEDSNWTIKENRIADKGGLAWSAGSKKYSCSISDSSAPGAHTASFNGTCEWAGSGQGDGSGDPTKDWAFNRTANVIPKVTITTSGQPKVQQQSGSEETTIHATVVPAGRALDWCADSPVSQISVVEESETSAKVKFLPGQGMLDMPSDSITIRVKDSEYPEATDTIDVTIVSCDRPGSVKGKGKRLYSSGTGAQSGDFAVSYEGHSTYGDHLTAVYTANVKVKASGSTSANVDRHWYYTPRGNAEAHAAVMSSLNGTERHTGAAAEGYTTTAGSSSITLTVGGISFTQNVVQQQSASASDARSHSQLQTKTSNGDHAPNAPLSIAYDADVASYEHQSNPTGTWVVSTVAIVRATYEGDVAEMLTFAPKY